MRNYSRESHYRQKSSVLIIVLGCVAFLTLLVVAFFASVSTERQSAQFYANNSAVKLLGDSVVDIVIGQIEDATKGTDSSGSTLAWASQPGMIRTYNSAGQPSSYYKLYSWANMIGAGAFNPYSGAEAPPSTWTNMPALYTDLNDPVSGVYPVVDPAATNSVIGFDVGVTSSSDYYPSSRDEAPMPVQWLYVLKDGSLATATGSPGNTVTVATASASNPIVGRIAFWTDDDSSKININTAAGDAWTNSPTGQPTTAGGFWDTPRIGSSFEMSDLALNQPVHGEFQRYPGHPATTFLSAVFPSMTTNNLYSIVPRVNGGGSDGGSIAVTNSAPIPQKTDRLYASVDELMFSTNLTSNVRVGNHLGSSSISNLQVQTANFFLTAHSRAPEVNLYNEPRILTWPVNANTTASYRTPFDRLMAFDGSLLATNGLTGSLGTNAYFFQRSDSMSAVNDLPTSPTATGVGRNRILLQYLGALTAQPVPGFSAPGQTFLSKYPGAGGVTDRDQILTEIFDYIRSLNCQDLSAVSAATPMTNAFTPIFTSTVNYNQMPAQAGQITPIYDSTTKTRGFGRFATITEASLLLSGIAQSTSFATNYPPYATNYAGYTGTNSYQYPIYPSTSGTTETWSPPSANWTSYTNMGGSYTNCAPGYTRVQPAFLGNVFVPTMGYASMQADYWIEVDGLNQFTWTDDKGNHYPMFSRPTVTSSLYGNYDQYGGYMGIYDFTDAFGYFGPPANNNVDTYGLSASQTVGSPGYPGWGNTLDLPTGSTVSCSGGTVTIKLRGPATNGLAGSHYYVGSTPGAVLQIITINFPPFTCPVPGVAPLVQDYAYPGLTTSDLRDVSQRFNRAGAGTKEAWITSQDVVRSMVLDSSKVDPRILMLTTNAPPSYFIPGPNYTSATIPRGHGIVNGSGYFASQLVPMPYLGAYYGKLVPNVSYTTNTTLVDTADINGVTTNGLSFYNTVNLQPIARGDGTYGVNGQAVSAAIPVAFSSLTPSIGGGAGTANGVFAGGGASTTPGDWDTGVGPEPDGAFVNKADEGSILAVAGSTCPYFTSPQQSTYLVPANFFSPNRMMPSAGMFGSLPTGAISQRPWQTLLFRPDPGGHFGATSPADFLLMDLFNMPVVEPYPISDPFSTAGKINMNYQIVPFTYITRSTGVQAVLRSEQMLAIPTSDGPTYKLSSATNRRYLVDLNNTLTGFNNMFSTGSTDGSGGTPDIFRSASEICNIWLVPKIPSNPLTYAGMQTFWNASGPNGGALTGDNVRERPYANIYPRLTTKSNTFTVHYRVQTLKKIAATGSNQWVEGTDVITGEYRGSSTLERYLDTSDTRIPDYAGLSQPLTAGQAIDNFYKFRVIETKQFTP